jgi:hypothetical protein
MNQYIITEELADRLSDAFWNPCKYNHCELMLEVYDSPYNPQAERERVLDDVIGFAKINSDFINKGQDGYAVVRLVTLVQICENLREGKDGE